MKQEFQAPDCAFWRVWEGREIEGEDQLGERTLFIRSLGEKTMQELVAALCLKRKDYPRVWFCEGFLDNYHDERTLMRDIMVLQQAYHPIFAFEIVIHRKPWSGTHAISADKVGWIRNNHAEFAGKVQVYYKLPWLEVTHAQDYICLGAPFMDTALSFAKGRKVSPEEYGRDSDLSYLVTN